MQILGAGLSGLLAACHFPNAAVYEARPPSETGHKAVLRFRSSAVGDSVGIEFRKVRVRKGIWHDDAFREPTIQLANWYARKVIGAVVDRSIWDLAPVDRYIAPENFQDQLIDRVGKRIVYNSPVTEASIRDFRTPTISTMPLSVLAQWFHRGGEPIRWQHAPIHVRRYRLHDADVFQTIYFPSLDTSLYRVSITGSLITAEYMKEPDGYNFLPAFGLNADMIEPLDTTAQRFGKILPVNDAWRKAFIFSLSQQFRVYSLGRYGVWRNLLLDDVIQDIGRIKKMINASPYAQYLASL